MQAQSSGAWKFTQGAIIDRQLTVGSINLNGAELAATLALKQGALTSSTALSCSTLKATGVLPTTSVHQGAELGTLGPGGMCRLVGSHAWYLRLEAVGQSEEFTRFTIQRVHSTGKVNAQLGTFLHQEWHYGGISFFLRHCAPSKP